VWIDRDQILDSISDDYYGGPLRDVFVGGLTACGIGMIAYKGSSRLEDYALNFAGVNTFFVALVSNSFQDLLDSTRAAEVTRTVTSLGPGIASSTQLLQNLTISVIVLLVVLVLFVAADVRLMHWTRFRWNEQTTATNILIAISWMAEIALLGIVMRMLIGYETVAGASIFSVIHFTAATLLIINLPFAAASHAFPTKLRRQPDAIGESAPIRHAFIAITALMWAGLVGALVLWWVGAPYVVIGVEVWEIVLFIAFRFAATGAEWTPQRVRSRRPGV
jgi:hypothetical protein